MGLACFIENNERIMDNQKLIPCMMVPRNWELLGTIRINGVWSEIFVIFILPGMMIPSNGRIFQGGEAINLSIGIRNLWTI